MLFLRFSTTIGHYELTKVVIQNIFKLPSFALDAFSFPFILSTLLILETLLSVLHNSESAISLTLHVSVCDKMLNNRKVTIKTKK